MSRATQIQDRLKDLLKKGHTRIWIENVNEPVAFLVEGDLNVMKVLEYDKPNMHLQKWNTDDIELISKRVEKYDLTVLDIRVD